MRTVVACKQFFSLPNFKSIRLLLRTFLHTDLPETPKSDQTVTNSGASWSRRSCFSDAYELFDELPQWDVVSVTTLISQLARQTRHNEAFCIFSKMREMEIKPNDYTLAALVHASTSLKNLRLGKQLHCYAIKTSFEANVFVGSAVLDLYAKLNTIEEAQMVFDEMHDPNVVSYTALVSGYIKKERFNDALRIFETMPEKNVVTWNAMIGGYSQKGHNEEAVNLFIKMMRENVTPTQNTFPCVLSSAGNIAALGMGKSIHASAIKNLGKIGLFIGNSLIAFYAKCGNMEDSLLAFSKVLDKNIVSWNALINGYAQNGKAKEAIRVYREMEVRGVNPNAVTFLGLLSACNHAGLVEDGYAYFHETRLKNPSLIEPAHYACVVDLLARSGRFLEAERFIQELPFDPGVGFWKALLGGCQIHMNIDLGELAARKILDLDPSDVSSYVMLSNAHSVAGRWHSVLDVRSKMKEKKMKIVPGCSWIEIGSKIRVFVNGDRKSDDLNEIQMILSCFYDHVREFDSSSSLLA